MILIQRRVPFHVIILLLSAAFNVISTATENSFFPMDVKMCSAKDQDINACFTDTANRMLKDLVKGSRKLNAVPMDPLNVPAMKLARNNSIAPTLALNYTDTVHEGWKNAVMLRSEINPKDGRFNIVIRIPQYRVQGRYQITGSIIGIPLEGSGHFEATGINMTNDMLMQGHLQERRGEKFFVIDDFSQKTHLDTMSVYLYNLFNNTRLANATNRLLNENHRAILDGEGGKLVNVLWGKLHEGLIQRIFDKVPYRIMFPDLD